MAKATAPATTSAMTDTQARLLALEIVTVAALNRLSRDGSSLRALVSDLQASAAASSEVEGRDPEFIANVQANVARITDGVLRRL